MINPKVRVTPKFRDSDNFNNILEFLTTYDEESLAIIKDMNNLDSDYSIVLDEIGKSLGVYPRPLLPKTIDGKPIVFTYGLSQYGTVPYSFADLGEYRPMTDKEYSKVLRVFALGLNFSGKIQEWEDILYVLTNSTVSFSNQASQFGIVVHRDLSFLEKKIIEYVLRYNSLTVSINLIGTVPEGTEPFRYGISQYGNMAYPETW